MCTKKELVEWLEANVPDDAKVLIGAGTEFESLKLISNDHIEYSAWNNQLILGDIVRV